MSDMTQAGGEITAVLNDVEAGQVGAADRLFRLVYAELAGMAHRMMRRERDGHTLDTHALVHEAFLRLVAGESAESRRHFFGSAARAMMQVLVDHARRRDAGKRGGDRQRVPLDGAQVAAAIETSLRIDLLDLEQALLALRGESARRHDVVMLKFFFGMEHRDIAEMLEISVATVERDWRLSRAWLYRRLEGGRA